MVLLARLERLAVAVERVGLETDEDAAIAVLQGAAGLVVLLREDVRSPVIAEINQGVARRHRGLGIHPLLLAVGPREHATRFDRGPDGRCRRQGARAICTLGTWRGLAWCNGIMTASAGSGALGTGAHGLIVARRWGTGPGRTLAPSQAGQDGEQGDCPQGQHSGPGARPGGRSGRRSGGRSGERSLHVSRTIPMGGGLGEIYPRFAWEASSPGDDAGIAGA